MQFTLLYPVVLGIGFISLIFSIFRTILNQTVQSYEEQIQSNMYKKMAYVDALSGIWNRNAFITEQKAAEGIPNLCYVILDIDNLKYINDNSGHSMGDAIICKATELIRDYFASIGASYRIAEMNLPSSCGRRTRQP